MHGLNNSKTKIVAGIIAMMVLLYIVLSTFFISLETNHECEDEEHCPICVCMQICTTMLHQISDITAISVLAFVPILLSTCVLLFESFDLVKDTPVTYKIRLND